jgi:hypothetical protein
MRYKPEWKGRLCAKGADVYWDGQLVGRITSRHQEGATSPGGMVTNTVWVCEGMEYKSYTQALTQLLALRVSSAK